MSTVYCLVMLQDFLKWLTTTHLKHKQVESYSVKYAVINIQYASYPTIPVHLYHTSASPITSSLVPFLHRAVQLYRTSTSPITSHVLFPRQSTCTVPPPVQLYHTFTSPLVLYLHQSTCTVPPPGHLYRTSASPQVPQLRQSTGTATRPVHRYRNSASPLVHIVSLTDSTVNPFKISSKRKRNNVVILFWSCVHRTTFYIFLFYMQR